MSHDEPMERKWFGSEEFLDSRPSALLATTSSAPTERGPKALEPSVRYEKIALIGQGGMGCVWLGWDAQSERNVAIKEPRPDAPAEVVARLEREVMLTAKLDHPGVVAVHDILRDASGSPLFVMGLVRGRTLASILTSELVSGERRDLLRHLLQICQVVGHAHQRGLLHRDLTPRNVIIEEDGSSRVVDWGLAVTLEEARRAPAPAGTPGYMSPEQRDGLALGPTSDVWGLGALLFTIMRGRAPLALDVSADEPAGSPLDAIRRRAMREDPRERYPDALAMADDLERWFEGRRVQAMELNTWEAMRWVLERHRRSIVATALIATTVVGALSAAALFASQEAGRARQSSMQVSLQAAHRAMLSGDMLEARRLVEQARAIDDGPRVRGFDMSFALIPEPRLEYQRELPECDGERILTPDPMVQICHAGETIFEAWSGGQPRWRVDLTPWLAGLDSSGVPRWWRADERGLVVIGSQAGAWRIELSSGRVERITEAHARFASLTSTELLTLDELRWPDDDRPTPCEARGAYLTHAYRRDDWALYTCTDGAIWR